MKKFFKVILLLFILILVNISSVYAVGIDMNLDVDNNSSIDNVIETDLNSNTANTVIASNVPKVSTTTTSEDFHLTVSDIINIILISVGVVIILLAISILIKIK